MAAFAGYSGFLHHLKLAIHDFISLIVEEKLIIIKKLPLYDNGTFTLSFYILEKILKLTVPNPAKLGPLEAGSIIKISYC